MKRRKSKKKKSSRINLKALLVAVALTALVLSVITGTLAACLGRAASTVGRLVTGSAAKPTAEVKCAAVAKRAASGAPSGSLCVRYIDVGQGDGILITQNGHGMLIDAGTEQSADTVVRAVKAQKLTMLDYCIGTHPHEDHIGGMDSVLNAFAVKTLIMPDVTTNTTSFASVLQTAKKKKLKITRPVPGTTYRFAGAAFTVLAPNSAGYKELNDYSVVVRLVYGSTSFLFTGDAQTTSEKEMLKKGYTLSSDVLKVGHHGSKTSTSAAFLKAVHPKYAVISVGKGNDYGLPNASTVTRLKKAGVTVYRTDEDGSIVISSDGKALHVATQAGKAAAA